MPVTVPRPTAAGWHVVLATGRPIQYVWPLVGELGIGEYVVAANGATVAEYREWGNSVPGKSARPVVLAAVASARAVVEGLRLAVTTPLGFPSSPAST